MSKCNFEVNSKVFCCCLPPKPSTASVQVRWCYLDWAIQKWLKPHRKIRLEGTLQKSSGPTLHSEQGSLRLGSLETSQLSFGDSELRMLCPGTALLEWTSLGLINLKKVLKEVIILIGLQWRPEVWLQFFSLSPTAARASSTTTQLSGRRGAGGKQAVVKTCPRDQPRSRKEKEIKTDRFPS